MTPGTDFSGHKHALVLSLTKRESVIYPNSQEGEKKSILSAFTYVTALPLQEFSKRHLSSRMFIFG